MRRAGLMALGLVLAAGSVAGAKEAGEWVIRRCLNPHDINYRQTALQVVKCKSTQAGLLSTAERMSGFETMPDDVSVALMSATKYQLLGEFNLPGNPDDYAVSDPVVENGENENATFHFTLTRDRKLEGNLLSRAGFSRGFKTDNEDAPAHTLTVQVTRADANLTATYTCAIPATRDFVK